MLYSTITQKGQATIPVKVRELLGLHTGDGVGFEMENGKVTISKISPLDLHYAKALNNTLSEWASVEDDEAYNGL
jgi:antitoxin PrlF